MLALGILIVSAASPVAAHSEPEPVEAADVYFLNEDGPNTTLTELPPSAANRTAKAFQVRGGYYLSAPSTVIMPVHLPAPTTVIDEQHGAVMGLRASYQCTAGYASWCGGLDVSVHVVEGQRRADLGRAYLSTYQRDFLFAGDFPGHGEDGGPHTHGAGDSISRELESTDFHLEIRITESANALTAANLFRASYSVSLWIDGSSWVEIWTEPAPSAPPASEPSQDGPEPQPASPPASQEPADNQNETTTQGNGTANSSAASSAEPRSVRFDHGADSPGLGLPMFIAAVAAGVGLGRRR